MKKRILALALAAATAFSMFGASLSVSAAYDTGAAAKTAAELVSDAIKHTTYLVEEKDENGVVTAVYADYGTFIDEMTAIADMVEEDETVVPENGKIYSYDYSSDAWDKFTTALDTALNAEDKSDKYYGEKYYPMLADTVQTAADGLKAEKGNAYTISAFRQSLLADVASAKADAKALDAEDYDETGDNMTVAKVRAAINAASVDSWNSQLIYALADYEAKAAALVAKEEAVDPMEALEAAIARAESILAYRDEYKTTSTANKAFDNLEAKLDAAYAIVGDYSVLNSKVKSTTSALVAACDKTKSYALPASAEAKNALNAAIKKAELCVTDPDYATNQDFENLIAASKKDLSNSEHFVVEATDKLVAAIDNLKVTPALGSYALAAQERLEKLNAFGKVETDYTAKSWAVLETALAQFDSAVTKLEYDKAETAVTAAVKNLVKVSTRAAKAEYTKVEKEAKALRADTKTQATKSQAAVNAFIDTVNKIVGYTNSKGEAVPGTSKTTVSEYEDATATLEAAIKAYKENKVVAAYEGWAYDKGVWTFYVKGEVVTGWNKINNVWYYMNDKGVMQTGWVKVDGAWYYLKDWGGMATGWAQVKGTWYFLDASGKCVMNTWKEINGKWYYFNASGAMAVNTTINGYKVDANGVWVK